MPVPDVIITGPNNSIHNAVVDNEAAAHAVSALSNLIDDNETQDTDRTIAARNKSGVQSSSSSTQQQLSANGLQPQKQISAEPIRWRPIIPDGGWGWMVVFGSFLIHVFADGFVYSFGIMLVELLDTFEAGRSLSSWVISLLVGLTLAAGWSTNFISTPQFISPVASAITNRYGCRLTTMCGAVIASFGCALSYCATSIPFLIGTVGIIMGIGFGLMYCPAIVIVTMYFEEKRAFATGIAVCGAGFGSFMFGPLSRYLIDEYTWRGAFLIYAGIILNCAVCGALFRPLEFEPIYQEDLTPPSTELKQSGVEDSTRNGESTTFEKLDKTSTPGTPMLSSGNLAGQEHETLQMRNGVVVQLEPIPSESVLESTRTAHSHSDVSSSSGGRSAVDSVTNRLKRQRDGADLRRSLLSQPGRATSMTVTAVDSTTADSRLLAVPHHRRRRRGVSESAGYLGVRDVFYSGSVTHIPEFAHDPDFYRSILSLHDGGRSATFVSQATHIDADRELMAPDDGMSFGSQVDMWTDFKSVLYRMANLALLRDPVFLLFCVSNFLTSIGFNIPIIYLPDKGEHLKIDKNVSSYFISIFGVANTVGRVLFGFVSDRTFPCRYGKNKAVNQLWIYNILVTVCGLATIASCVCKDAPTLMVYSAVFGLTISAYVTLTSVLLVALLGLDKLTNAFGLLLLFQGIASLIGAPIGGWIVDVTHNFDYTFVFAGVSLLVSGVMLYVLPCLKPDLGKKILQ